MTTSNLLQLSRAREAVNGVAATGPFQTCLVTSESFKADPTFETSATITGNRATEEHVLTALAASSTTPFEHAYGYMDWALDLLAMNLPRNLLYVAPGDVASIEANGFTAPGDWIAGMLVKAYGHADEANNGLFEVTTGGSGSFSVTESLTVDADPAGSLRVVGFAFAANEITATASGIESSGTDLTTLGLQPGDAVHFSGFTPTAMNTFATVVFVTATAIGLTDLPGEDRQGNPLWQTSQSGTIRMSLGEVLRHGDTLLTDTFRKGFGGIDDNGKRQGFLGVACDALSLDLQPQSLATGSVTLRGFTGLVEDGSGDAAAVRPETGGIMSCGTSVARVCEGGTALAKRSVCQGLNLNFANNLTPVLAVDDLGPCSFELGDAAVSGNAMFKAGEYSILEKMLAEETSSLTIPMKRGKYGYVYSVPNVTYTDAPISATGRNTEVKVETTFEADFDTATGTAWSVTRFHELV